MTRAGATRLTSGVVLACGAGLALLACTGLAGLTQDDAADGGESGVGADGATADATGDAGTDTATCKAVLSSDAKNCGRCGHDCLGANCTAGKCEALELSSVTGARLDYVTVTPSYIFVSTRLRLATDLGGVWRIPKAGGVAEPYVLLRYAEAMAVLDGTLYFVAKDDAFDGAGNTGGLYSCPIAGIAPCAPALVAPAQQSRSVVVDRGRVLYGDDRAGKGIMSYVPPAEPVVFRPAFGFARSLFVDGDAVFYSTALVTTFPQEAKLIELGADGGAAAVATYRSATASDGWSYGGPTAVFFAAYDFQTTAGGVLTRVPRGGGGSPCDLGGSTNARPYGVYADTSRVYWTNQGVGANSPFTDGRLMSCPLAGCCTTPEVLLKIDGEPGVLAGETDALYFVTRANSSVWRIAKP